MSIIKAYSVRKIGWEYNDEYYYHPDCGGGEVEKVFYNRNRADNFCKEKNIKDFREIFCIGDYNNGENKLSTHELNILNMMWNKPISCVDEITGKRLKDLTDFQIEEVMRIFKNVVFYEVVPVDVDVEI